MKKTFVPIFVALMAFVALGLSSCDKNDDITSFIYITCESQEAEDITPITAKLKAKVSLQNIAGGRMYASFYYSTEKTDLRTLRVIGKRSKVDTLQVKDTAFAISLAGLQPSTTYYYAPSVSLPGIEVIGDMRSFTTTDFCLAQPATNLTSQSAILHAIVSIPEEIAADCSVGFEYTVNDFTTSAISVAASMPGEDGKVSATVESLDGGVKYYFRAYVLHNAVRIYSNVLSFTTPQ